MDKNNENQQTKAMETWHGGCHCGTVRFSIPRISIQLLNCNCSICQMSGFLHLIVPHHQFRLTQGSDKLSTYRFNTKQAEHLFCSTCGIKSFYQPRSHPDCWSVGAKRPADPVGWRRAGNEQKTVLPEAKKSSVNAVARQSEGRAFDSKPSCAAGFHTQYERREARHLNAHCLDGFNSINWEITHFDGQNWRQAKQDLNQ